ncbi:MAG TPA: glycoside hydrolase family 3 N-terminal domain-containing protein, partial [Rugosimonospora sp.]|nr:glycoside hydrolase family 3 N-terminal domain-containing protein [Rugosimonospora sp.]
GGIRLTGAFRDEVARWGGIGALYGLFRADAWSGRDLETGIPAADSAAAARAVQEYVRDNTRLGIPVLLVEEAPHGHQAIDGTVLPVNLAVGAGFDPDLYRAAAGCVAAELRARGAHVALVSALDVLVDPRWGRAEECFGEDPHLAAVLTDALVRGAQGEPAERIPGDRVAVVLKHFAAQGAATGGLNAHAAPIGPRELHEIHLPAARAGVRAGAAGVMAAYNEIDGVPCAGNRWLLTDLLRGGWGFTGVVLADGLGVDRLARLTGDLPGAAALALTAGVDLSLWDTAYTELATAVSAGLVGARLVDRAAARVLRLKFRLGLFDEPPAAATTPAGGRDLPVRLAEQGLVLLANAGPVLPLSRRLARIAVLGPNADDVDSQTGDYTAPRRPRTGVSVLAGIRAAHPGALVRYGRGSGLTRADPHELAAAVVLAADSDVAVLVLGGSSARRPDTTFAGNGAALGTGWAEMTGGEGVDVAEVTLPPAQLELARAVAATGTPTVAVLIQGRPHALADLPELCPAILCAWYPGPDGGTAVARALFGEVNPGGRLPVSIPRCSAVLPVVYNAREHGNPTYRDVPERVAFGFGAGTGYTTVEYRDLRVSPDEIPAARLRQGDTVAVRVRLANTGTVAGDEVVQVYTRRLVTRVWPRTRELKGFRRVALAPGEEAEVVLHLGAAELGVWTPSLAFDVEPGRQLVMLQGDPPPVPPCELTVR